MPAQFDIILQKQNLGPHAQVHPAMHMPSHGEYLVELLVRGGLKSGLMFGLDDFAYSSPLLNQSAAEILIVCGADQHFRAEFARGWQQLKRAYALKVLIVSEPIYSPLAFYLNPQVNAEVHHQQMLEIFEPDIVLYLSRFDVLEAQKRHPQITPILYSLADPGLITETVLPWQKKEKTLLYLGKSDAWVYARSAADAMPRIQQLDYFVKQKRVLFAWSQNQFSFRQCYSVVNQFCFQLQLRSGYAFHTARTVQSALLGSIPVIVLHRDEWPILQIEAPFAKPDRNLLLGFEDALDELIEKLHDDQLTSQIQTRLSELLSAGTIRQGVAALLEQVEARLGA